MKTLHVHNALIGPDYEQSGPVRLNIGVDGYITSIEPGTNVGGPARLAIPSMVDAHNHARPVSPTSFGCGAQPLEQWLPHLAIMPPVDAYLATSASLARSLKGGATSVMIHLTRPMGLKPLAEEARDIARAARDLGISIGLAVAMRDRNPLVYGDQEALLQRLDRETAALVREVWLKPMPSIERQLALVDEVAEALVDQPHVDVQYGPNGVQWCSDALLGAIAEASARTGRRVHMHLLETKPQRDWADAVYSEGIVAHLKQIGLLSDRLALAHCVWVRPDELPLIAASGTQIAVNNSSNLHLYSGLANVRSMVSTGVRVAMGLDGCTLDEDDDACRELRLLYLTGRSPGFESPALTPQTALKAACQTGRTILGLPKGGYLAVGMPADLMTLDLDAMNRDNLSSVSATDLLFARGTSNHIRDIWSKGTQVMEDGRVLGIDLAETEDKLRDAYRAVLPATAAVRAAWPTVAEAIADHYREAFA